MNALGKLIGAASAAGDAPPAHAARGEARGAGKGGVFSGILARLAHGQPQPRARDAAPDDGAMEAADAPSFAKDTSEAAADAGDRPRRKVLHLGEKALDSAMTSTDPVVVQAEPSADVATAVQAAAAVASQAPTAAAGAVNAPEDGRGGENSDEAAAAAAGRRTSPAGRVPVAADRPIVLPRKESEADRPVETTARRSAASAADAPMRPVAPASSPKPQPRAAQSPPVVDLAARGESDAADPAPDTSEGATVAADMPTPDAPRMVPDRAAFQSRPRAPAEERPQPRLAAGDLPAADAEPDVALRISGAPDWRPAEPRSAATLTAAASPSPRPKVGSELSPQPAPSMIVAVDVVAAETHLAPTVPVSATTPPLRPGKTEPVARDARTNTAPVEDDAGEAEDTDTADAPVIAVESKPALGRSSEHNAREANAGPVATASGDAPATPAIAAGLPSPALRAVANAVAAAAGPAPAAAVTNPAARAAEPARVMTLRFEVPEHGGVNVRMTLRGTAMHLDLRADREDTARRLRHDRDALTRALAGSGYDADIRAIDFRAPDAPSLDRQPAAQGNGGTPGQGTAAGQGGADQRPAEARGEQQQRAGAEPRPAERTRNGPHDQNSPDDSRAGGLYV